MPRNNNSKIIRAGEKLEYTHTQIIEMQRCMMDPVYLIKNYGVIQHPIKGAIKFDLYDYQEEMIRNFQNNQYTIVLSARQTGKSWTAAAYLLWFAMYHLHKTVFIVSNKNETAMEMIDRVQFLYQNYPAFLKPGVADDGWNKHSIKFDSENGSEIVSTATTATAGRSYSISLLFCDEFAFVPANIQQAFWSSINPTLATGGSCIITSTPNGDTNLFATLWRGAEVQANQFKSQWVRWDQPPGRDEAFKRKEIGNIGAHQWKQEYECEFLSSDALLFDSMILNNLTQTVPPLPTPNERGVYVWTPFQRGKTYLMGIDPATGIGSDFSVIEIFEFPSLTQVMEFRSNTTASAQLYLTIKHLLKMAGKVQATVYFSVENNGVGEGIIALYHADEDSPETGEFVSEEGKNRLGFTTLNKSKMKASLNFKGLVERNKLKIQSAMLLKEMKNYIRKGQSFEANIGATDDCISACLIVCRLLEEIATYEQAAYDTLYSIDESEYFSGGEEEYDPNDTGLPMIIDGPEIRGTGAMINPQDPDSFDPWGGRW